jgi:hypothetical protein
MNAIELKYQGIYANMDLHKQQREWCTENFGPEGTWKDTLTIKESWTQLYIKGFTCWYFANEKDAVMFALRWS